MTKYRFQNPEIAKAAVFNGPLHVENVVYSRSQDHIAILGDAVLKMAYYSNVLPFQDATACKRLH